MKRPSLRLNLMKSLALPLAAAIVLIGIFSAWSIYHEVDEVYDATLVQFARTLSHTADGAPQKGAGHLKYERNISYRILRGGKLVAQSSDGVIFENIAPSPGFTDQQSGGETWRFFTLTDGETGHTVEVAEKYSIRHELILQLLSSLILPGAIFILSALAVLWWGVTRGLQRLARLSADVDRREAEDLTPIADSSVPAEIQPLLDAINRLFSRITQSFAREREFTDNAAHELRTPLAAMKTQAQVLAKTENLSEKGKEGLGNLLGAIDRAADMVEGLLEFARLQSDMNGKQDVDFGALVEKECAMLEKAAAAKSLMLEFSAEKGIHMRGLPRALEIMVRNIVQNAIKFSPPGGRIAVAAGRDKGGIIFSVADTGPGIPEAHREKVFERFFRISKSAHPGSGLGLAMVKWIAGAHGAAISLSDNKPSGLVFTVTFS